MGCLGLPLLLPHHHQHARWLWFEADVPRACSSQVSFPAYRNGSRRHTTPSPGLSPQTQDLHSSQLSCTWVTDYTWEGARIFESDLGLPPSLDIISSVSLSKLLSLSKYQFPQFKIGIIPLTLQDGHEEWIKQEQHLAWCQAHISCSVAVNFLPTSQDGCGGGGVGGWGGTCQQRYCKESAWRGR